MVKDEDFTASVHELPLPARILSHPAGGQRGDGSGRQVQIYLQTNFLKEHVPRDSLTPAI